MPRRRARPRRPGLVAGALGAALAARMGCATPPGEPTSPSVAPTAPAPPSTEPAPSTDDASSRGPDPTASHPPEADPAESPPEWLELAVPGALPSVVSFPRAAHWPQPVLVVAHGAGGSAEWHCDFWRRLIPRRGVLLCLRGREMVRGAPDEGHYYPDHLALGKELRAALRALSAQHSRHADVSMAVYAGYSQGASMGLLTLVDEAALAPRLLLVEGGAEALGERRAQRLADSGAVAVALVCGTADCQRRARRAARALDRVGLRHLELHAVGAGHTMLGGVESRAARALEELTRDDARWQPPQ